MNTNKNQLGEIYRDNLKKRKIFAPIRVQKAGKFSWF
jgi:hypothetical protein